MGTLLKLGLGLALLVIGATVVILYGPGAWLNTLGIDNIRTTHGSTCHLVLLISGVVALVSFVCLWGRFLYSRWDRRVAQNKQRYAMLQEITSTQRSYLRTFLADKGPIACPLLDTDVQSLRRGGILSVVDTEQESMCMAPHTMNHWARKLLGRHPELLEDCEKTVDREETVTIECQPAIHDPFKKAVV